MQAEAYRALAFDFMTKPGLTTFENSIQILSPDIDAEKLSYTIVEGYETGLAGTQSRDGLLQLLAHFIDLRQNSGQSSSTLSYLNCVYTQITFLSSDIMLRLGTIEESGKVSENMEQAHLYLSRQYRSLVGHDGISRLVKDFSRALGTSSGEDRGASLLAGYILALLRTFPGSADDTRMKIFLEQIPTSEGETPVVRYLWSIMQKTSVFQQVVNGLAKPIDVLRLYVENSSPVSKQSQEEQDWRVILLFLELYTFVLRLSDDEDFFSGIFPKVLQSAAPISRLQACSLSLQDVKLLTSFLKVMAFTIHYRAHEISKTKQDLMAASNSRLSQQDNHSVSLYSDTMDITSLREILTTSMKMLYERDSRKPFLPPNHWLMTENLDTDDFINAVILEERQQREAENSDEDEDEDEDEPAAGGSFGFDTAFYSTHSAARLSRNARQERLKAQHQKAQRERRRAEMGPKLEILKHMPFAVPFDTRVMIFRQFVELDRSWNNLDEPPFAMSPTARHHGKIRRGQLFEDAFQAFEKLGDGLKDQIQITFVDQFGAPEAGIDGGGVTKEFLTSVTAEAFGNEDGGLEMFSSSEGGLLYPNPTALDVLRDSLRQEGYTEIDQEWRDAINNFLRRYEFLGRIVGKCMYEGILVDLSFAGFFLLKWPSTGPGIENNYKGSVNDLRDMDDELYRGMLRLKNYSGDITDLAIDFTIEDQVSPPNRPVKTITRKLIPGGDTTLVTNDNRLLYIFQVARHRLVSQPSAQTSAFLRGLRAIIRPTWLSMFNQSELQRLVGGDSSEIDVEDLRRNTHYSGLYEIGDDGQEHPTIKLFWKVMHKFTDSERRDVIKYVSSTPRAPLLGFSQLRPRFSIRDSGSDQSRLPSTSTCVNLLKLPLYSTERVLREKLLYAVQSGAGFDLS